MQSKFLHKISTLWSIQKEFRLKVLLLSTIFFLMMGCQAIWRPLKTSIFSKIVGAEYTPDAKLYTLIFLIPLIIFYSYLVDYLRRHQLVYCFTLFHAIGGLIFYFLLKDPSSGIANTAQSPSRLLGWSFYLFMESFCAFMSATFWSFANSINNPKDAENYYGFFVSGSKLGGILAAGVLYLTVTSKTYPDHLLLPGYVLVGSIMLLLAALSIYLLMKLVPGYYMHGYEAAYQAEKNRIKELKKRSSFKMSFKNALEGLVTILQNPYVFGIFSLVIFYDIISAIFDYRVLRLADAANPTAGELTAFYALYYLCMHGIGLLVSFFGTTPMQRLIGVRLSLFVFPIVCIFLIIAAYFFPYANVLFIVLVLLRALNYALNHPTREALYIPTTKAIKFKASAWTNAFGSRIAKGTGSVFNKAINHLSPHTSNLLSTSFNLALTCMWVVVVYLLGKTLSRAIQEKRVIGETPEEQQHQNDGNKSSSTPEHGS